MSEVAADGANATQHDRLSIAHTLLDKVTTITDAERKHLLGKALEHQQRMEARGQWLGFVKYCLPFIVTLATLGITCVLYLTGHEDGGKVLAAGAGLGGGGTAIGAKVIERKKTKQTPRT